MKASLLALLLIAGCDRRAAAPAATAEALPPAPAELARADVAWTTPWSGAEIVEAAAPAGVASVRGTEAHDPGAGAILVLAAARAPAATAIATLHELAARSDDLWLGVEGAGVPALALRFTRAGGDPVDGPVVDLRASGVSVRRADDRAHGEIPWSGGAVDVAAVAAAHQHVMRETGRGATLVTVDATVTVQQLVTILGVLRGDGATAFALAAV